MANYTEEDWFKQRLRRQAKTSYAAKCKILYFFREGVVGEWHRNNEKIDKLVDEGKCKPGAILAYGSLDSFCMDKLIELAGKQRVSRIKYQVAVEMLEDRVKAQNEFIANHK